MASVWALALEQSALLRWLVRCRWPVLGLAAVAAALVEVHTSGPSSDGPYFAAAGRHLLSSDGLHVYAARGLQAGPLQIGAFGGLARLCRLLHVSEDPTYAVISTVASTALVVAGVRALRRHVGLAVSPALELLIGALAIGWLLATEVYTSGHPAELVIPALWIAAAVLAAKGRPVLAGLMIGVGAGFETWAVLGLPVLLASNRSPAIVKSLLSMVAVTMALYAPFVIAGPFRMSQAVWDVAPHSLVHALDPAATTFPWSARLVQSLAVVAVGILAWWSSRRSPSGVALTTWFIPAAIAMAKAISEPSGYDWYWLPAEITLLAGFGCADGLSPSVLVAAVAAETVAVCVPLRIWPVAVVALVVLLVAGWRQSRTQLWPSLGRVQRASRAA